MNGKTARKLCQRFELLALTRAEGRDLEAEDRVFEEAHLADCEACRRMAATEALLRESLTAVPLVVEDELSRRRLLDGVLAAADREPESAPAAAADIRPRWRARTLGLALAAALLAAFGLGLLVLGGPGDTVVDDVAGVRVVSALGDVRCDGQPLTGDRRVATGQVLEVGAGRLVIEAAGRVTLHLEEETRVRPESLAGDEIRMVLERGQLLSAVTPLPAGQRYVVATRFGRVYVVGTMFSVRVGESSAEVRVTEGTVLVTEPGRASRSVRAGERVVLGQPEPVAVASTTPAVVAAPTRTDAVEPPVHRVRPARKLRPAARPGTVAVTARDLLDAARGLRLARDWRAAADAYQELIRAYPGSVEAGAALVALGEVQLDHLGQAEAARRSFTTYLERERTALAPEALFGEAAALRRLGRHREEVAALQELLDRYPQAAQAPVARRRLAELGAD